tara:strand:+ start:879 stop:1025 length:147 start_codon:yes stop_codon:yes gene_type:complete
VQLKQLKKEDKKMVFKSTLTWQREERIAAEAKAAEEAKKKSSKKKSEE